MNELYKQTSYLSSSVNLISGLLSIATETKSNSFKNIESIFTHHISYDLDEVSALYLFIIIIFKNKINFILKPKNCTVHQCSTRVLNNNYYVQNKF